MSCHRSGGRGNHHGSSLPLTAPSQPPAVRVAGWIAFACAVVIVSGVALGSTERTGITNHDDPGPQCIDFADLAALQGLTRAPDGSPPRAADQPNPTKSPQPGPTKSPRTGSSHAPRPAPLRAPRRPIQRRRERRRPRTRPLPLHRRLHGLVAAPVTRSPLPARSPAAARPIPARETGAHAVPVSRLGRESPLRST